MSEPTDPYAGERYDPTLAHCTTLSLHFNGTTLEMRGGSATFTYSAVSGRPDAHGHFDYSAARQRLSGAGPIPEGGYWIRPDELWENAWYRRASTAGWGNYRITIHPFTTTATFGRGGFFIHGGTTRGSAGCIDLTSDMDRFAADLVREAGTRACQIHVTVDYP
jgi:hypothetical protein